METKTAPQVTVSDIVTPKGKAPTVVKKGESPLELAKKAKEVMQGQLLLVGGEIQRKLKDLVDDYNSLKEFEQPLNWGDPSYHPYLVDLGLQPIGEIKKTSAGRPPKQSNGKVEYRDGTVKAKIMAALKDGSTLDIHEIAKATKLDKKQLPIALGQMKNKDGTITSPERGKYKVK
jgi:hypothetical protein